MNTIRLSELNAIKKTIQNKSSIELLNWVSENFSNQAYFATSLGVEDQIITDMIVQNDLNIKIFTLDTGRMFNESYDLLAQTELKYGIKIEIFNPESRDLEKLVIKDGINGFKKSIENRKRCCTVRKLNPLKRALSDANIWICGLRREQSVTREDMSCIEWDGLHAIPKLSPLIDWSEKDVWNYIKEHKVPYNKLHDKGFLSIGCASCTRAITKGEDIRAGRWWWEAPEHKECGLHSQK